MPTMPNTTRTLTTAADGDATGVWGDGAPAESPVAVVTVVRDGGISLAGEVHHLGAVVVAPREAVRDAIARGLVVEDFEP